MRRSISHPLQIACLSAPTSGVVGLTFCPGKHQPNAATGAWARDLEVDLAAIQSWGAWLVLSLVTHDELFALGVPHLGERVQAWNMLWAHCPILDGSVPTLEWEQNWERERDAVHAILDRNGRVLVHCKGGLGRAGLLTARILIERGASAAEAVKKVRAVRSGAIETLAQEAYVAALEPMQSHSEAQP